MDFLSNSIKKSSILYNNLKKSTKLFQKSRFTEIKTIYNHKIYPFLNYYYDHVYNKQVLSHERTHKHRNNKKIGKFKV